MIILNLDLDSGTLKLGQTTIVKYGSAVPVQVVFATAPGTVTGIELALGDDSSSPSVLAFTSAFTADNATTWSGLLSTLTTQLNTFMGGKSSATVNGELTVIVGGNRTVLPNVAIAVQQLINNGSAAVTAGQSYYTESEVDTLIAAEVAARNTAITNATLGLYPATNQSDLTPSAATTAALFAATEFSLLARKIIPGAGGGAFTAAYTLPTASMATGAIVEANVELPASANPTVEIHDGGGTLLSSVTNPAPAAAAYWYGRFRFDGTAWHTLFRAFQS